MTSKPLTAALGLSLVLAAFGCTARAGVQGGVVYGYPVVTVDTAPAYVYDYPRVAYRGRYAYLVHDRWYYPTNRGWVVFREEPRELRRYRVYYRDYGYSPRTRRPGRVIREPAYGSPIERRRRELPLDYAPPVEQRRRVPIDRAAPVERQRAPDIDRAPQRPIERRSAPIERRRRPTVPTR